VGPHRLNVVIRLGSPDFLKISSGGHGILVLEQAMQTENWNSRRVEPQPLLSKPDGLKALTHKVRGTKAEDLVGAWCESVAALGCGAAAAFTLARQLLQDSKGLVR